MTSPLANMPDPDVLASVSTRLAKAAEHSPEFADARPHEVIRHVEGKRTILRGQFDGQKAVFRVFHDSFEDCKRDWSELTRIWPKMQDGPWQVSAPLAALPDLGLMVIVDVPGTPLLQLLYQSEPEDREKWLIPAAKWLRTYTECTESEAPAAPAGWAKRAERAAKAQEFSRLRRLEKPILEEIKRLVPALEGGIWRHAIGHGDFHPNNLIAGAHPHLTGIDCGGSRATPIYKDIARFLMHMGRRGMIPSGDAFLGVDRRGLKAFADVFDMTEKERTLVMPFFIAVEALLRAETRSLSDGRVRRARKMSEALLEDLRKIAA